MSTLAIQSYLPVDYKRLVKEFGYSEKEFVAEAVEDKLLELKKLQFFAISEDIKKGLKRKGEDPKKLLKRSIS